MNIFSSIWHHISVGISAALIVALHFVAPVSTNQTVVQQTSNAQTSSLSISSTTPTLATTTVSRVEKKQQSKPVTGITTATTHNESTAPSVSTINESAVPQATSLSSASSSQNTGSSASPTTPPQTTNTTPAINQAPAPPANTTQCNGGTYSLACPAGEHFFCPTNGTTAGQCLPENAQYCNGAGYSACPAGDSFSCSSTGGMCSPPPTTYVAPQSSFYTPPPAPAGPTPAQQTATCQQQYNTALTALNSAGDQKTEASLNNEIATDQQWLNQSGANGMSSSGLAGYYTRDLAQAQAELASEIAAYNSALGGIQNTLQTCLNNITQ